MPRRIIRTYFLIAGLYTLSASLIWGVNTLFLLEAGLDIFEVFVANAVFTASMALFEIPTGVLADTRGRRASFLLSVAVVGVGTLGYVAVSFWGGGLAWFCFMSVILGIGYTFYSGAVEAWLVDALDANGYDGDLESIFARGQVISGGAMLTGSVAGGAIAQATSLGMPYLVRTVMLVLTLVVAFRSMHDLGFTPDRSKRPLAQVRAVASASVEAGWRNPPVRWLMLEAPFSAGVGVFAFYAMQPHLLDLWGDPDAYAIAGLAAAVVAGAQIVGGLLVPVVRRVVRRRTDALALGALTSATVLAGIAWTDSFAVAVALLVVWAMVFSLTRPLRAAFVNGEIPSAQRATVLSADALAGSAGGVVTQPVLGRVADVSGYPLAYGISAIVQLGAIPFVLAARATRAASDPVTR